MQGGTISCYFPISPSPGWPRQALGEEGGRQGTFILEHKKNISQNNQGPGRPSLALACPSISLSKYLEGRKVSQKLLCAQVCSGSGSGSDPHPFRVLGCPPQAPRGQPCPPPGHSKSQPLSASWDPGILGPAPGLPSLLISHQTRKPPPPKGEAGGRRDCCLVSSVAGHVAGNPHGLVGCKMWTVGARMCVWGRWRGWRTKAWELRIPGTPGNTACPWMNSCAHVQSPPSPPVSSQASQKVHSFVQQRVVPASAGVGDSRPVPAPPWTHLG